MSELRADTITASDGTSPVTLTKQSAAKAWVNYNGTGTIASRDSFNFSSLTDNGTGAHTVTISSAMSDANCAPVTAGMRYAASTSRAGKIDANMSASSTIRLFTGYEDSYSGAIATDLEFNHIAVHGDLA